LCPLSAAPGQKRVHLTITALTNNFGVDAVLPADLGGAPRATRQHTKTGKGKAYQFRQCMPSRDVLGKPLPVVEADPVLLEQVLQNLIGNAIQYHRPGQTPMVEIAGEVSKDGW